MKGNKHIKTTTKFVYPEFAALFALMLLLCFASPVVGKPPEAPTVVLTRSGWVRGAIEGPVRAFRGIPYAAPPLGELRWRPPELSTSWDGVRDATSFGPACIQLNRQTGQVRGSEDCLTLNVYTAASGPLVNLPVMFFIHGGGNRQGAASQPQFDAPLLATHGVVVVTIQYRLGALGFLAQPLLTAEGGGSSGNYALMDMIAALKWVRDNIGAFGGDAGRVMIFGESSGGTNVAALMTSPAARGLFSRAAIESGAVLRGGALPLATAEAQSVPFVAAVGCDAAPDVLACLRVVPPDTIVLNQGDIRHRVVEPRVLPVDTFDALAANGAGVPLLIGSNTEETTTLGDDPNVPISADQYTAAVHAEFDELGVDVADHLLELYPASDYDSPIYALVALDTDVGYSCATRADALAMLRAPGAAQHPIYCYVFTHRYENAADLNILRAFHGAELPFVFGTLPTADDLFPVYVPTEDEIALSNRMMDYWASFAAYGNPNGSGPIDWRRYTSDRETLLQLDVIARSLDGYHTEQCDFISTLYP